MAKGKNTHTNHPSLAGFLPQPQIAMVSACTCRCLWPSGTGRIGLCHLRARSVPVADQDLDSMYCHSPVGGGTLTRPPAPLRYQRGHSGPRAKSSSGVAKHQHQSLRPRRQHRRTSATNAGYYHHQRNVATWRCLLPRRYYQASAGAEQEGAGISSFVYQRVLQRQSLLVYVLPTVCGHCRRSNHRHS